MTTVAVVGLGPVGTVLAGLLGRHGVQVTGFDRAPDVYALPRAAHIDHTGLRTLQALGCLDEVLPEMIPNPGVDFVTGDERVLASIPGTQPNPSNLPASMYFHQPQFDRTMRRAVGALPAVNLRVATEVVGVAEHDGAVTVQAVTAGGAEFELSVDYVVACDGASSPVREALGIGLDDLGFHEQWLVVDLRLREPLHSLPDRAVTYCATSRPLGIVPMPGTRYRFELMLLNGEDAGAMVQPDVVERLVSRWVPPGAAELERAAVYFFHGLVAESWRAGRVFLAGDAAHQMPPFLGQGMNSGFRDATNLAWKLALVGAGDAPDALLDTYELERKPHVRSIVESSVRIGRVVCVREPAEADPGTLTEALAFRLPRLEPGPLVVEGGGRPATQAQSDDGTRLFDDIVGTRFLVLARDEGALGGSAEWWAAALGALVATPSDYREFEASFEAMLDRAGAAVLVVRPDRYLLGAGARLDPITEQVKPLLAIATPADPELTLVENVPITFATWDYDRVRPLMDGVVRPRGIDLRVLVAEPPHHFFRMLHHGEFEASEMSMSWYTRTLFREPRPFQAIPAFPSRMFRHSAIYVNADAGIRTPADLKGKRVGCPEYQMTLAVWVKGILQDLYDVPVDSVSYHTGGLEEPGRREVAMDLPDNIVVEPIGDDRVLSQLLEDGEIEALYGPEPSSFRRSAKVRRLFEDYPSVERQYLRETGIFPIMHTVVIRQDVLDANPWVARELMTALEEAKEIARERLFELGAVMDMLPWLPANAAEVREAFGTDDWWPYGIEPNRQALDTFLRYSYEQGLCPRRVEVDELFFPTTHRTARK